jgi:hypothetical protein
MAGNCILLLLLLLLLLLCCSAASADGGGGICAQIQAMHASGMHLSK